MATTTTGASATVDPDRPPPLPLHSIPIIDLKLLSQSELLSLSMCSNSSFDLNRCDDVVIPKIDRSVFNESAGSRKQTYSRLRLAPAAQSSTSTKTNIHRRTPRLRSSHTPTRNNINDAEQAENFQIIRMLKELFKSDNNFKDLVPIEVEIDTSVVVPELLNTETNVTNRKRGRRQKDENAIFIHPPVAKRTCNNTGKEMVVYDADRDLEIVNSRGVRVNLEDLGRLEDPYGFEIRRRTDGMSSKDELLGFLGGLEGEWVSSRKKRKVVDASKFGDALPKGWRLSLSIKKKLDRVWLFCRRYISPSGRQFESCKEVSMYLLSLLEEENLVKPTHTKAGASFREDTRRNKPIVLGLPTSLPGDFKQQVKSNIVDPIDVQVEEVFKCLKCFMIFEGKVNLLDHQVLAHKTETSQLDSAISEWVVVKGGIFECQFCNKTFSERNQYNEHIGTHGTNETKTCEASEAPNTPFGDKLISASPQNEHKISSGTGSEINEHGHDFNILAHDNQGVHVNADVLVSGGEIEKKCNVDYNEFPERDKVPDVSISKSDFCLAHEASISINESNGNSENSGGKMDCFDDKCSKGLGGSSAIVEKDIVDMSNVQDAVLETGVSHADDKLGCNLEQGRSSGNSPLLPSTNELLNPETNRKRGRRRRHENADIIHPLSAKKMCNNKVNKVVACDADVDIEIVNSRGVKVNLENLGRLEDPYGLEIRRRTEGMSTKDELLGFLGGLSGHWGTSRKKRRVVDASEFGDALPKSWMLSLSIKKKSGRVWLFCRRYISPSGRQFESCKEVSMYLLSIVGEENLDKSSHTQSNDCDDFASKGASVNADVSVCENLTRKALSTSLPRDSEKQDNSDTVDPIDVQVQEVFKCLKCFMIFEGKINLLDHHLLAHKTETSKLGSEICEWMVVKGGIFECHLCNRTFNEGNQYNEHIGIHETNETKTCEASEAPTTEKTVDPVLFTEVPDNELAELNSAEHNVLIKTDDTPFGDKLISASPESDNKISSGSELKTDEPIHDLNILAHDMDVDVLVEKSCDEIERKCNVDDIEFPEIDKAPDVSASKSEFSLGHEASMSINVSNAKFESSIVTDDCADEKCNQGLCDVGAIVEKDIVGMSSGQDAVSETGVTHVDDKLECVLEQGKSSENSRLLPFTNDSMGSAEENVGGECASDEVLHFSVCATRVQSSNICEGKGFQGNINVTHMCSSFDDLTSEKENVINEDIRAEVNKLFDSDNLSPDSHNASLLISSKKQDSPQNVGLTGSTLAASVDPVTHGVISVEKEDNFTSRSSASLWQEKECVNEVSKLFDSDNLSPDSHNASLLISSKKQESPQNVGLTGSTLAASVDPVTHGMISVEKEDNCTSRSSASLWQEKECVNEDVGSKAEVNKLFDSDNLSLDSHNASLLISSKKQDSPQNVGLTCSTLASSVDPVTHGVISVEKEDNFTSRSSASPWQEKECVNEDVGSKVEEPQTQMNMEDFPINNNVNNVSSERLAEINLDDFQIFTNDESLNNEDTGVMGFNAGNNLEFCSLVPPVNEQDFSFQDDDVSGLYDRGHESSQRGFLDHFSIPETYDDIFGEDRGIGIHELSLAFGSSHEQKKDEVNCSVVPSKIEHTFDVQTDLSMVNDSMIQGFKGGRESVGGSFSLSCNNETRAFSHNGNIVYPGRTWGDLTNSGSNQHQSNEVVGNQQQNGLANSHGLFRGDERYNDSFSLNGSRSGRSEPVEFSFLSGRSEHNPLDLQGGSSGGFPYNTGMEQGFGSAFWSGKNGMVANMGGRNVITSVCAWCRNEFHILPETQGGAGSLCPSCSAGMSGQVNML